jgi:TMEM175 potassium channel family protein
MTDEHLNTPEEAGTRVSGTSRVEAFSDGVMAIAITLLVLDLRVPTELETAAAGGLLPALLAKWPNYVAYLAGFFTIGIIWLNHHALVNAIRRFDWRLMWLNLLLLLGVATLPFTTAVMAEYVAKGGLDATVAAAFYGALALVMAVPWTLIWMHLRDHPYLLEPGFTADDARAAIRRNVFGPLVYGAAIVVAFISPIAALAMYIGVAVYFALGRQPEMAI